MVVKLEELIAGQLAMVVFALRPLVEFAANGIDPVVYTLALIGGGQHRLQQTSHFGMRFDRHAPLRAALQTDEGLHVAD